MATWPKKEFGYLQPPSKAKRSYQMIGDTEEKKQSRIKRKNKRRNKV